MEILCIYVKIKQGMDNQKGIALYLSIIIMVILLAIVLGMSTILLGQFKIIKDMENSVIAFYAAETGIEMVLDNRLDLVSFINTCPEASPCSVGDAEYYVDIVFTGPECSASNVCIKSVGTYKNAVRALQASY